MRVLSRRCPGWLIDEHVRPLPGSRILDLGCGPAWQLDVLPPDLCAYDGVDINPAYVEAARRRAAGRLGHSFQCEDVTRYRVRADQRYDIVMAIGLLHHLDDSAARQVIATAHEALVPGGRLITYDGVYVAGQSRIARWLLDHDRGRYVRTEDEYRRLAGSAFDQPAGVVLHDTQRLPYTTIIMTCVKPDAPSDVPTGNPGGQIVTGGRPTDSGPGC